MTFKPGLSKVKRGVENRKEGECALGGGKVCKPRYGGRSVEKKELRPEV